MEDKETFGITKKKLEHSAVPRLNEHPETNIKMVAGRGRGRGAFPFAPGHRFFSGKITFLQAGV